MITLEFGFQSQQLPENALFFTDWPARCFNPLRYQPGGIGNWSGHLPFACDLIAALRPKLLVELGTHYGESYFGFCQAVEENAAPTRCYAIDTWQGDEHAGFYGDDVHDEVAEYNRKHYASFSSLLRMTFDEAAVLFSDASIDLLHIDGMHTYEAVAHDFFNWLPKVTPGGVILLHDVVARSPGFGVWKLWEELAARFAAFTFYHSWGLGVLRTPGPPVPDEALLRQLFGLHPAGGEQLRRHYSLLAESLDHKHAAARARINARDYVCVKVYTGDSGYVESQCVSALIPAKRWQRLKFELPNGSGAGRIRVDPCDVPALIDIAEIRVVRAGDGCVLWQACGSESFHSLEVNSQLRILSVTDHLRCASFGFDPQMLLPELSADDRGQSLCLEILLSLDTELSLLAADLEEQFAALGLTNEKLNHLMLENKALKSEIRRLEDLQSDLHAQFKALKDGHSWLGEENLRIQQELTSSWQREADLQNSLAALGSERALQEHEIASFKSQLEETQSLLSVADAASRQFAAELDALHQHLLEERETRSHLTEIVQTEKLRNQDLLDSWSWRVTRPLRWVGKFGRR
jgi:hypothetical protein